MGSISARKFAQVVDHVRKVLAIEALVAAQGLDFRAPLEPGRGVAVAHAHLRKSVPTLVADRTLHPDIEAVEAMLFDGSLLAAVRDEVGTRG